MKRILTILISVIMLLCCVGCSVAPAPQEMANPPKTGTVTAQAETVADAQNASVQKNPVVLLNGYNKMKDFDSIMMHERLGKITLETDKTYVKTGEGSMKITLQKDRFGGLKDTVKPYIYQATIIKADNVDYSDFGKVIAVEFDIFNAQTEEGRVGMRLVYKHSWSVTTRSSVVWYTLPAGQWTTVRYMVEREFIPPTTSTRDPSVMDYLAKGMEFMFDRADSTADKVYYLDDVRLYRTQIPFTPVEEYGIKEHEITSYDQQWQVSETVAYVYGDMYNPILSRSKEFTTDGGSSMRIDTQIDGGKNTSYIRISKTMWENGIDWKSYEDDDVLCFDVYSPRENGLTRFGLFIYGNGSPYYYRTFNISPGQYMPVRITVKELKTRNLNNPVSGAYVNEATFRCFEYTSMFAFSISNSATESYTLFIDNMRMEKAA